jgi:bacterioferritin-associated ferredoxin
MIVCVCNALCDQRCKQVACSPASRTVGCIYRAFGCRVRCGKCVPMMAQGEALGIRHLRRAGRAGEREHLFHRHVSRAPSSLWSPHQSFGKTTGKPCIVGA